MKAVWKGTISFGLVTIPVELFSAVKTESVSFTLLHKKDLSPIEYKRWCTKCNKEVGWNEIVKGIKLPDGSYFVMSPSQLEKLKPTKTDAIGLVEFVPTDAIEPIYYNNHYYVSPTKNAHRAFALFAALIKELNLSAIGTFVMRDKEYVCALKEYHNGLLLSTLHYAYEVRKATPLEDLELPLKIDSREKKMATELIQSLTVKELDISDFKNTFTQELMKRIQAQMKGKKIPQKVAKEIPLKSETTLLDALRASLEANEQKNAKKKTTRVVKKIARKKES